MGGNNHRAVRGSGGQISRVGQVGSHIVFEMSCLDLTRPGPREFGNLLTQPDQCEA